MPVSSYLPLQEPLGSGGFEIQFWTPEKDVRPSIGLPAFLVDPALGNRQKILIYLWCGMPTIITFLETVKEYICMAISSPGNLEIQSPNLHISLFSLARSLSLYTYRCIYASTSLEHICLSNMKLSVQPPPSYLYTYTFCVHRWHKYNGLRDLSKCKYCGLRDLFPMVLLMHT